MWSDHVCSKLYQMIQMFGSINLSLGVQSAVYGGATTGVFSVFLQQPKQLLLVQVEIQQHRPRGNLVSHQVFMVLFISIDRSEATSESSRTPKMESFLKMFNDFQPLNILAKHSILDVRLGSEYASVDIYLEVAYFLKWRLDT